MADSDREFLSSTMAAYWPQCQKREKIDKRRLDQGGVFTLFKIEISKEKKEKPGQSDADIRGK